MSEDRLSRLLNSVLVCENRGLIEEVADRMGESYNHVHKQVSGYVNIHVNTLKAAFLVTKDPRLKRELEPEGYELVQKRNAEALRCPESEATDIVLQSSNLIEKIRQALADGKITQSELLDLEKSFCDVERELIEARTAVRNAAGGKNVKE